MARVSRCSGSKACGSKACGDCMILLVVFASLFAPDEKDPLLKGNEFADMTSILQIAIGGESYEEVFRGWIIRVAVSNPGEVMM